MTKIVMDCTCQSLNNNVAIFGQNNFLWRFVFHLFFNVQKISIRYLKHKLIKDELIIFKGNDKYCHRIVLGSLSNSSYLYSISYLLQRNFSWQKNQISHQVNCSQQFHLNCVWSFTCVECKGHIIIFHQGNMRYLAIYIIFL